MEAGESKFTIPDEGEGKKKKFVAYELTDALVVCGDGLRLALKSAVMRAKEVQASLLKMRKTESETAKKKALRKRINDALVNVLFNPPAPGGQPLLSLAFVTAPDLEQPDDDLPLTSKSGKQQVYLLRPDKPPKIVELLDDYILGRHIRVEIDDVTGEVKLFIALPVLQGSKQVNKLFPAGKKVLGVRLTVNLDGRRHSFESPVRPFKAVRGEKSDEIFKIPGIDGCPAETLRPAAPKRSAKRRRHDSTFSETGAPASSPPPPEHGAGTARAAAEAADVGADSPSDDGFVRGETGGPPGGGGESGTESSSSEQEAPSDLDDPLHLVYDDELQKVLDEECDGFNPFASSSTEEGQWWLKSQLPDVPSPKD